MLIALISVDDFNQFKILNIRVGWEDEQGVLGSSTNAGIASQRSSAL